MGLLISKFVFMPPDPTYDPTLRDLIFIESRLPALWLDYPAGTGSSSSDPPFTILFSHGNAEDLGTVGEWLRIIRDTCHVQVLAYEYEGYGIHAGSPSEAAVYRDISEAFRFLVYEKGIPAHRIVLFGRSLGSGPTVHLAHELFAGPASGSSSSAGLFSCSCRNPPKMLEFEDGSSPAGVVLQSPLTSVVGVVSRRAATTLLALSDMFVNVSKIERVRCPTLIIHGREDAVVPFAHGQLLSTKACNLWHFLELDGVGHNDVEEKCGMHLLRVLRKFLDDLHRPKSPSSLFVDPPQPPPLPSDVQ